MDGLVDAVGMVMNGRSAELVCIGENVLWGAELATAYTVRDWWTSADRDRKTLLSRIANKTDFPEELGAALKDRFYLSEFFLEGVASRDRADARGLGAAFLLDGIAVSLPSEDQWKDIWIPLVHVWLAEGGSEGKGEVKALNLSGCDQAEQVRDSLLRKGQRDLVSAPTALTARKHACFPHLRFGLDVDDHIARLATGMLAAVIHKLIILDDASRKWRRNAERTSPTLPGCRPETDPTMQKYGDLRVFLDAEGVRRTYALHCAAGPYRIHLRVVNEPRGLEIGYVGKHLPTKKYP